MPEEASSEPLIVKRPFRLDLLTGPTDESDDSMDTESVERTTEDLLEALKTTTREDSAPPPRHKMGEKRFTKFLMASKQSSAEAKLKLAKALRALENTRRALDAEKAKNAEMTDDSPVPKRTKEEHLAVSQVPDIKWDNLPTLNFDNRSTVLPWTKIFEQNVRAKACSERQKLDYLRNLPGAADGCLPQLEKLQEDDDDYTSLRNKMLSRLGYVSPVTAIVYELARRAATTKSTPEWKLHIRNAEAELILADECQASPTSINERDRILATAAVEAFSGENHSRLSGKLRNNKDSSELLETILTALPRWERSVLDDHHPVAAAAQVYRPTSKSRPNKGQQQRRPYADKRPQRPDTFRHETKRTDRAPPPPRRCRSCHGEHDSKQCPAYGHICSKCGTKNHFSSACRTNRPRLPPHPMNQ